MNAILGPIASLLLATSILLAGNGLQGTLIAVRANIESFPLPLIGLLMSSYYVGFMIGCFFNPRYVKQVGHIRTFAALASVASAVALLHAFLLNPFVWLGLRAISGFCFAGLSMITESWINEKATNKNRGRILSIYRIVDLGAVTVGQILLTLADPAGFPLFAVVSILVSLALVPVSLTTAVAPRPISSTSVDIRFVMRISPLAGLGACAAGLSNGAFWGLGPVFVQNVGFGTDMVAGFMSSVIVGGAIVQYPVGMLSDRLDRRHVLIAVALIGGLTSLLVAFSPPFGRAALLGAAFVYGAMAMSHYSMAVAHANDRAAHDEFVKVSSALLFLFGVGAAAGPFLASLVITAFGSQSLFIYTAAVQLTLVVYGAYRLTVRPGVPIAEQAGFLPAPRTTPEILDLDPRSAAADTTAPSSPPE